ncbi:hypothetical protein C0J52_14917 [Blattella germanica]|nr:hypothetical protein C0J52_14917 [Blattella germanica]
MWKVLVLLFGAQLTFGTLPDLECPEDCECHYFRINWVTDCSESNFTDIPHEGLSQNVYILNMNSNNVTEIQPFPEDIKLRRLQIADNLLTNLKKESFAGLSYLLDADFSGNQIRKVDPDAFRDSPGLITLELQENPLDPVDGPFLSSMTLLYLDLSDCNLTRLSSQFFANTTSLNKLDLSGNPLTTMESGILNSLGSLEDLKLNRCNLTTISETAFRNLTNLKTLELSQNYLTMVQWSVVLKNLVLLDHLDLRKSSLTNLPDDAFIHNNWLRSVVLAENELRDLDVGDTLGHNLQHLDSLDLSNCHLKGPLSDDAFANATKLRTLILSGNFLSPGDLSVALAPLSKLHKLSLRNCGLTRLPPNTFHRLSALEELDISHNPLNDAFTGILSPLETLEVLDMSYSNLSHISRGTFSKMNHLKHLKLSGNMLTDLESGLFQNLTHLRKLELNHCDLSHPPREDLFKAGVYEDFEELHMSGNPLFITDSEPLLPYQLSNVQIIDISNCNLNVLPNNAFNSTPKIESLNLSGNQFGSNVTHIEFIKELTHLRTLDLRNCNLSHLSPNIFSNSPNITSLKLSGNPWKCDCYIHDLWAWASVWKHNISVLVGAVTVPEDIVTGRGKRKKGLHCHYDITNIPAPQRQSRTRPKDIHTNRTWAKYVKESYCMTSLDFKYERYQAEKAPFAEEELNMIYVEELPPTWLITVGAMSIIIFLIIAIVTGTGMILRRSKKERSKNYLKASFDLQDIDQTKEVTAKRRRNQKFV